MCPSSLSCYTTSNILSGKYSQTLFDHAVLAFEIASKGAIKNAAEANGGLVGNKIADKIKTKVSKDSQQNNSEIVRNEHDKEILQERYISLVERQKIIDDLRLT